MNVFQETNMVDQHWKTPMRIESPKNTTSSWAKTTGISPGQVLLFGVVTEDAWGKLRGCASHHVLKHRYYIAMP